MFYWRAGRGKAATDKRRDDDMESYAEAVILWSRAILRGDRPAALRHRRELDRLTPIDSRDYHLDNLRHVLDEVMEGLSEAEVICDNYFCR